MDFYPYDVIILVMIGVIGCLSLLGALLDLDDEEGEQ